ncbi:MAG: FkbM family methyltransferase [Opitutales bacterium]|nr:FkbM family methyltransferase [Opitutales bacterium]
MGLTVTLFEIWKSKVYTHQFYHPKRGNIIIDAGANIGIFSLWLSQRCPDCKIYAFEPFRENIAYLEKNIEAFEFDNIEIIEGGIAGASGYTSFSDHNNSRSVDHRLSNAIAEDPTDDTAIRTYCMSDIFKMIPSEKIDFFKIDVEGSELEFFESLKKDDLLRIKKIAIEYHDNIKPGTKNYILSKLEATHTTTVKTDPGDDYGMIYAKLKA